MWRHHQEQGSSAKEDILSESNSKSSVSRYYWPGAYSFGKKLWWYTKGSSSSSNSSSSSLPVRRSARWPPMMALVHSQDYVILYVRLLSLLYYIIYYATHSICAIITLYTDRFSGAAGCTVYCSCAMFSAWALFLSKPQTPPNAQCTVINQCSNLPWTMLFVVWWLVVWKIDASPPALVYRPWKPLNALLTFQACFDKILMFLILICK